MGKNSIQDWEVGYVIKVIKEFQEEQKDKLWNYLKKMEFKDLVQECYLELVRKRKRYIRKKSSLKAFITLIIRNKLYNLAKEISRKEKKDIFEPASLNTPLWNDENALTLEEKISDKKDNSDMPLMKAELYAVLSEAIPKLPTRQRKICNFIKKSKSRKVKKTEIAKGVKINRKAVRHEMKRMKKAFIDGGIEGYLEEL